MALGLRRDKPTETHSRPVSVANREEGSENLDVILRAHPVGEFREVDLHLPADVLPVLARVSELKGLRAFPAIGLSDAQSLNSSVHEREDQIPWLDLAPALNDQSAPSCAIVGSTLPAGGIR
jgi:hypothetical protein